MPLAGGPSDKLGNRYELRWTVRCMIEVMDEHATSIRLEPPGTEGEGIEFWLCRGGEREYHQVKRQHGRTGHWTLADLQRERILARFWEKTGDATAGCVFVSAHSASELDELCNRARGAASWEEFEQQFLRDKRSSTGFAKLRAYWGDCQPEVAYERLKRIRVETEGEDILQSNVESQLATLVEGDPTGVSKILAQFALDQVHHELTAHDIWHELEQRGYARRNWGNDPRVLAAAAANNNRYLSLLKDRAILGRMIPRAEVQAALDILCAPDHRRSVMLVGEAGVGKSSVILQVVETLQRRSWPVLAFRVDRLEPEILPARVGEQLGLPGSPADVLAAVAQDRECLLVIDQLDAVSLASGRLPQFLDCMKEIIKQAPAHPRMHLLLGCRKFDLDNDDRLRRLTEEGGAAEAVVVDRLPRAAVQQVVTEIGLEAARLSEKQLDLLSVPLHLSLLAEVARASSGDVLGFGSVNDLYDRFWNYKQDAIRERLGNDVHWAQVVDGLCDYMNDHQVLSAPEAVVDEYARDARAMVSEHVLVLDDHQYAFFHEGFFDYAFARHFVARGQELVSLLGKSEQHLFQRAQVRQILVHERDADRAHYLADLEAVLNRADIRYHIKASVFAWLGTLDDPSVEEWSILRALLGSAVGVEVWNVLQKSVAWFKLVDSLGLVSGWLARDDEHTDRAILLLSFLQRRIPDRVAELLEPYVAAAGKWPDRLRYVVRWGELGLGRRFFDLFLRLLDQGTLDGATGPAAVNSDFRNPVYSLWNKRPEWACKAIGHYLNRRLELSLAGGQPNPFDSATGTIPDSQSDERIFLDTVHRAPAKFISEVFPFILRVVEATAIRKGEPPWSDRVWSYRTYGPGYRIQGALLSAMEAALADLARSSPDEAWGFIQPIRTLQFDTVQYLIIRAYTANGARFANEAAEYLCDQPGRLETGYYDEPNWATRKMLEAVTPHCSDEDIARLEAAILSYYPGWERSKNGGHSFGYAQMVLLEGIDASRRSVKVKRRIDELRRKFGEGPVREPKAVEAHWVPPPIPEKAAGKMTDEQWLGAIAHYNRDDVRAIEQGGGVHQLSNLLERQVKEQPARFAELVHRFPDDTHPYYFDAVLGGIADSGLDAQIVLRACRRCHNLSGRPCGRTICDALAKLAEGSLPNEALDIVAWYALEDPDPERESWRTEAPDGGVYYGGDILTAGINSVRGRAAEALGTLIFHDGKRLNHLEPTVKRVIKDRSIAVRALVAEALVGVLKHDRDLAVELFQELCEAEDTLLKAQPIERFLYYGLQTHFAALESILKRMIASENSDVAVAGARQACLAALLGEAARPLAECCLYGAKPLRVGAANVYAANLGRAQFRASCIEALVHLFADKDDEVRSQAAACFDELEDDQLGNCEELVNAFVSSEAFGANYDHLIRALERSTAKLPETTRMVCERFLDAVGTEAGDIRTSAAFEAQLVSKLLVRVYSQSRHEAFRSRCLDLVDRMTRMRVFGLEEALTQFER